MKQMKQIFIWLPIGAIILSGCSSGEKNKAVADADQAVTVKVQKLGTGSGATEQAYIGTIEESVSVPLSFLISGTVEKVLVEEGQSVTKGQLLAVINSESYQNMYQIALSKKQQAQDAYNRLEPVYKKGSLPEIKYIEVKTGLEQANSATSISEKNLKDCHLYAPTCGMIGRKTIEPGMSIIPGNTVFQLVKIEKVKVTVPVPEKEISGIAKGQNAQILVSAIGDQRFEGQVSEIGVLSNPLSHTYTVKVELNNPDKILRPGMVCNIRINNPVMADRIIIPLSAVQEDGNGDKFVYVANPETNKASKRPVQAGPLASNGVVIRSGLSAGDLVITEGYQKINKNSTIQIIQ